MSISSRALPAFVGCVLALVLAPTAAAQSCLFDFDTAPYRTSLPIDLTVDSLTAHFTYTGSGSGFSVQRADVLGFTPVGFSGLSLYPNSVFANDLKVAFSSDLTDFSILYAPEEYGCDNSAVMRVTAYKGTSLVGTSTMTADPPGTWPSATLAFSSLVPFDNVVVHYDTPPSGENWGPIFMADNMLVTPVPEPSSAAGTALVAAMVYRTLRRGTRATRAA